MISGEDLLLLSQLVLTLEQLGKKLQESYSKKDFDYCDKIKKEMLNIQSQISRRIK
jgi:hypothetical protein